MGRKEYSFEIRDRCEGLYVNEGKALHTISKLTGIPEVTLQRWSVQEKKKNEDWGTKRKRYCERMSKAQEETRAIMREEILLQDLTHQRDLLKKYFDDREEMEKGDIQAMYAYTNVTDSICKILADMRKRDESLRSAQKIDRPQIFLDFMRDLVSFLKEHDPAALEALEKNFDEFIGFAKTKYAN